MSDFIESKEYKLIHDDCLNAMQNIADASIDLILCDLPFGITACAWDIIIPFELLWCQYNRIIKKGGNIILFGSQPFSSDLISSARNLFKYELIWEKSRASNFLHSSYQPLKAHENILIFGKGGVTYGSVVPLTYNPQKMPGKPYNKAGNKKLIETFGGGMTKHLTMELKNDTGNRMPRSVCYFSTAENDGQFHPTQKPILLLEYLIKTYSNENDVVLDNCMGSGSTGVACLNTNRRFIGIEKDEKYFSIATERMNVHIKKIDQLNSKTLEKFFE